MSNVNVRDVHVKYKIQSQIEELDCVALLKSSSGLNETSFGLLFVFFG